MLHVLYLVHDLSDPAVRRRVMMLQAGGAKVTLAGFRRATARGRRARAMLRRSISARPATAISRQRLAAVARAALSLGAKLARHCQARPHHRRAISKCWRLPTAQGAVSAAMSPIVYECLDIHRLLLGATRCRQGHARRRAAARPQCRAADHQFAGLRARIFRAASARSTRRSSCWRTRSWNSTASGEALQLAAAAAGGRRALEDRLVRRAALPQVAGTACRLSRAGWTAASKSSCAAVRPIREFADFDGFVDAEPSCRFRRRLPQPRGPGGDLRRGPFLLGDRFLRGRPEFRTGCCPTGSMKAAATAPFRSP